MSSLEAKIKWMNEELTVGQNSYQSADEVFIDEVSSILQVAAYEGIDDLRVVDIVKWGIELLGAGTDDAEYAEDYLVPLVY